MLPAMQFMNQDLLTMQPHTSKEFPIGKKIFAKYTDEFTETNINFIPAYIVQEGENLYTLTEKGKNIAENL